MKIISVAPIGLFSTNCYIVISDLGNAAIVDAPANGLAVLDEIKKNNAVLDKILLTHGHCDHIETVALLAKKSNATVYIHSLDEPKLYDDNLNLSSYFSDFYEEPVTHYKNAVKINDGDSIALNDLEFKVLHTPGHTSGSVCFILDNIIFSGDTLFNLSVGRTDMIDGDAVKLQNSLQILNSIDNSSIDYNILAGHGGKSRLSVEKARNPYLKGFSYDDMF